MLRPLGLTGELSLELAWLDEEPAHGGTEE